MQEENQNLDYPEYTESCKLQLCRKKAENLRVRKKNQNYAFSLSKNCRYKYVYHFTDTSFRPQKMKHWAGVSRFINSGASFLNAEFLDEKYVILFMTES